MADNEEHNKVDSLMNILSSAATFFSVVYAIILTLSISYNVGYFKQINPQIVDLMGIGDYIDDTVHNLWFFLLAALLFFSSSLAMTRIKKNNKFYKLMTFGSFSLVISSYFLLKGIRYSKFWPTIKKILINDSFPVYFWLIGTLIIALIFLIYKATKGITQNDLSTHSYGVIPIVIFFIIVLMPYLGGLVHGYIESNEVEIKDYYPYSVQITFSNNEMLKEAFLIKKLDKGILIRQCKGDGNSFIFVNWGVIKTIQYYNIAK